MSVVSLVILLENVACVVVQEDAAAAALDIVVAQAMDAEVIVLVPDLQDVAVPLLVGVGTASHHHIVVVRNCHMLMEMVQGNTDKAGAKYCKDVKFIEETEIKCV
ncbi:3-methyl-2-oxobutanoate hydroxymethyltransferase [Gossypium arboreum]|uniref:3-methyl-2-oxobutanoate hydroxymethyltransferase n=1 Tax=Gossypium arboreum TaxID=29729 RepID=A0A0B0PU85_GOSAR|nr:3-methyl-2-oxobutanoate hydroxymethyltransferase [Gossypium arboreum]